MEGVGLIKFRVAALKINSLGKGKMNKEQPKKTIRVWIGGCFDILHFGHANAMRQAKALGDVLVVGVLSDEVIEEHKGPTVMTLQERVKLVKAVKWVDEVVEGYPYITTMKLLDDNNCDFCVHDGDEPTIGSDGHNTFQEAVDSGRFKPFKRTRGISTTGLLTRILNLSIENPLNPYTGLCTSKLINAFSDCMVKEPQSGDKVIYAAGDFDLFHVGHVDFLSKCLELGNYIIVGLHEDKVVNSYKGGNFPIMNLHERVLGALACRYVSDVVIGAPYKVDDVLLDYFNIDYVVHGRTPIRPCTDGSDPYEAARKRGIFRTIDSGNPLTTNDIVHCIIENRLKYEERNRKKEEKELRALDSTGKN